MLQPNQREMLLVNRRIVCNFLKVRGVAPETFEANEELRKAVRGARTKQRQDQQAKKKEKQKSEVEKSKEISDLYVKKTRSMITFKNCRFSYKMILSS